MMNNPFYYAMVWKPEFGKLHGEILTLAEYTERLKMGARLHSFTGRTATVAVIDFDQTISREQKLDFAVMFMRGDYVTITVDLKYLTSEIKHGTPPP